jgi:hypothetical protein
MEQHRGPFFRGCGLRGVGTAAVGRKGRFISTDNFRWRSGGNIDTIVIYQEAEIRAGQMCQYQSSLINERLSFGQLSRELEQSMPFPNPGNQLTADQVPGL